VLVVGPQQDATPHKRKGRADEITICGRPDDRRPTNLPSLVRLTSGTSDHDQFAAHSTGRADSTAQLVNAQERATSKSNAVSRPLRGCSVMQALPSPPRPTLKTNLRSASASDISEIRMHNHPDLPEFLGSNIDVIRIAKPSLRAASHLTPSSRVILELGSQRRRQ
jgi:hypothetical protein